MGFSPKFLFLVSNTAKTSQGECLVALICCLSFHLFLCISNLLGAMGKMLILATLCNYSKSLGLMHVFSIAPIRIWPYVVLIFLAFFFLLPAASKLNLCGFSSNTNVRIIFRHDLK